MNPAIIVALIELGVKLEPAALTGLEALIQKLHDHKNPAAAITAANKAVDDTPDAYMEGN